MRYDSIYLMATLITSMIALDISQKDQLQLSGDRRSEFIFCPSDFVPEPFENATSFSRRGTDGKSLIVYRCLRGLVWSGDGSRREVEVPCGIGPNGGVVAPLNGTCVPGFCSTESLKTHLKHSSLDQLNSALPIDHSVFINCNIGYSIDGLPSGPRSRQIRCDQDTSLIPLYSPVEDNDCKPIRCGEVDSIGNAHIVSGQHVGDKIYMGDVLEYECEDSFYYKPSSITSQIAAGTTTFSFKCTADGSVASIEDPSSLLPGKCVPANCPMPPDFDRADLLAKVTDRISVGDEIQYVCDRGATFFNSTVTIDSRLLRFVPMTTRFRVACIWDSTERTGIYDTDPARARCSDPAKP